MPKIENISEDLEIGIYDSLLGNDFQDYNRTKKFRIDRILQVAKEYLSSVGLTLNSFFTRIEYNDNDLIERINVFKDISELELVKFFEFNYDINNRLTQFVITVFLPIPATKTYTITYNINGQIETIV